jgi:hypothetical protein
MDRGIARPGTWGNHRCIAHSRDGYWDSARVGAGASPIKTERGWLEIYHGANDKNRYCLGVLLLDLEQPWKVIARSEEQVMEPLESYERDGFFGEVIFTNGHVIDGDEVTVYYGASDRSLRRSLFDQGAAGFGAEQTRSTVNRLARESAIFLACPRDMRFLLVTNMIYAFVLSAIEIFVAAYVMRNSHDVSKVVTYQLAIYAEIPWLSGSTA